MNFPDSDLWIFSTQTYALPDVESTCLQLQDQHDADINIIMYCLWIAEKKHTLDQADIQVLIKTTEPWQKSILKPLRDARKMMKQHIFAMPSDMLEQTVKNLGEMELNAEHMSQLALEKAIDFTARDTHDSANPIDCASNNLVNYLQQLNNTTDAAVDQHVTLLNAIYQDPEAVQVALMNLV